jgi:hypothetical protein
VRCKFSARGILKDDKVIQCLLEGFRALRHEHWRSAFCIDRLIGGSDSSVTGTLETDGTALCVRQKRPKNAMDAANACADHSRHQKYQYDQEKDVVVGLDPARTSIAHAIAISGGESPSRPLWSLQLTRRHYCALSGTTVVNAKAQKWNDSISATLQATLRTPFQGTEVAKWERRPILVDDGWWRAKT